MQTRTKALLAFWTLSAALLGAALFVPPQLVPLHVPPEALQAALIKPTTGAEPRRLKIETLGVDVPVVGVGLTPQGNMGIPEGAWEVGWFNLGYRPGEEGNAVIAGHLDTVNGPAVFQHLEKLQPGDVVTIENGSGSQLRFRVTDSHVYDAVNAPMREIFGSASGKYLRLITCDGAWIAARRSYESRLVVTAELDTTEEKAPRNSYEKSPRFSWQAESLE